MLTLLQANTADLLVQEAAAAPEKMSLIKMAVAGGWLMIVLLILSIIAIYILGNRLWAIRQAGKLDPHFMANIRELVRAGKTSSAISLCRENSSPIARLIEKGLERQGNPLPDIQAAVENVANIEVAKLEKGLPMLATVAGGAPMIGFLGTVIGMIQAFYNMASAGSNIDITLLSGGIYTAMVTTVGGLFVGIIAYFGYNWLTSRVNDIVFKMESETISLMDMLAQADSQPEHSGETASHRPARRSTAGTARTAATGTARTAAPKPAGRSSRTSGTGTRDTASSAATPAASDASAASDADGSSETFTIDKYI